MLHWIAHLVGSSGYVGIAVLMAIENVVLPLPSELIMPLAGFDAAYHHLALLGVIVAGTVGSVAGALPVYAVARAMGEPRLTVWVENHGRWLLLGPRQLKRAAWQFNRWGRLTVFVSQLIPGLRGLVALPAGFARMNVAVFAIANFAGTLIWCGVLAWLGSVLGANYRKIDRFVAPVSWVVLGTLALWGVVWVIRRRQRAPAWAKSHGRE